MIKNGQMRKEPKKFDFDGPLREQLERKGVSAAGISFIMDSLLVLDSENRFAIGMSHPYLPGIGGR